MSFKSEKSVNQYWQDSNILTKLEEQNKDKEQFIFYDGPPFASGNPHYGHILAGTIKDIVTRSQCQMFPGKKVRRVWGWDTHGVPIESKANKELGINSKEDVLKMGLDVYNQKCREYVMSCQDKWKIVTNKLGRWIDMDNAYKTMDSSFMNSVWYVFSELFKKGLIYHGVKIMSYSPGLESPLSNNEANLNYQSVNDPSLTLQIPININDITVYILVWTTTPWTLACNLLLCVHPDLDYVLVTLDDGTIYVLLENQVKAYFKKTKYHITTKIKGSDLVNIEYKPLFPFYKDFKPANPSSKPFHIIADTMVSSESGTGIVHIAPSFGQEDLDVSTRYGLISNEVLPPCPLNEQCYYIAPVADMQEVFGNRFCKDSDKDVVKYLKTQNKVFKMEHKLHDYPYCYRTDKPLIYRTCAAWFIKVKDNKEKIKNNLMKTNWVPTNIRDNKYMEMLDTVVDWCISRNRFWGTPLPIWTNGEETITVGSARELEVLANLEVNSVKDLHPEFIFDIIIPSSKPDGKPLKNVKLVLDCWFESGSMPFGQWGYPFNPDVKLNDIFPADFIAEGTDQTRGWFHALMTIYTLLIDKPPFKNVIVNGIVQSQVVNDKGNKTGWAKMSKKDGNYSDPETVIDEFGADTLRLFLVKSAGVRGGDVPFDTKTFKVIHKNYYIMIENMVVFWKQSLDIFKNMYKKPVPISNLIDLKDSISQVDIWIIQVFNDFLSKMNNDYKNYQLYFLTDYIDIMIDRLSRWYIKLSKKHLKGDSSQIEFQSSISILTHILHYLLVTMSPITPFMSETFYLYMKEQIDNQLLENNYLYQNDSIHLQIIPQNLELGLNIKDNLLDGMELFIQILDISRCFRSEHNKPLKMPIKHVTIAYDNPETMKQLKQLETYLKQEVNSQVIEFNNDPFEYIKLCYTPNKGVIGKQFGKNAKDIIKHLDTLKITDSWFNKKFFEEDSSKDFNWRYFTLPNGFSVQLKKEYFIEKVEINKQDSNQIIINQDRLVMIFDLNVTTEISDIYYVNCMAREIQEMRKEAKLTPLDVIQITYNVDEKIKQIMQNNEYKMYLNKLIQQPVHEYREDLEMKSFYTSEREVANYKLTINFHR